MLADEDHPDGRCTDAQIAAHVGVSERQLNRLRLNTHNLVSLYKAFDKETAGRLRRRLRLVHTPKKGSWLIIAEMELSVLSRQCLGERRFPTREAMQAELTAWMAQRNAKKASTRWQFTTDDARVKLLRLYPIPDNDQ